MQTMNLHFAKHPSNLGPPIHFLINVNPHDTVLQVKERIEREHPDVVFTQQALTFKGQELLDGNTVSEYLPGVIHIVYKNDASTSLTHLPPMAAVAPTDIDMQDWEAILNQNLSHNFPSSSTVPEQEVSSEGSDMEGLYMDLIIQRIQRDKENDLVIKVGSFDTVRSIKERIQRALQIPIDRQVLFLNDVQLIDDNCQIFQTFGGEYTGKVKLFTNNGPSANQKLHIHVKVPSFSIEIDSKSTLGELKIKIFDKLVGGLRSSVLMLPNGGKYELLKTDVLSRALSLQDCRLSNHSEAELVFASAEPPVTTVAAPAANANIGSPRANNSSGSAGSRPWLQWKGK